MSVDPVWLDRVRRHARDEPRLDDGRAPWEPDVEAEDERADQSAARRAELLERATTIVGSLRSDDRFLLEARARGVRQTDAGRVLGKQQSSVSYQERRLMLRLRVLGALPVIPESELRAYLARVLTDGEAATCLAMREVPCHRQLAPMLGVCTGTVRNRCDRAIVKLRAAAEGHDESTIEASAYRLFRLLFKNQTLIHRQIRPVVVSQQPSATLDTQVHSHESKLE